MTDTVTTQSTTDDLSAFQGRCVLAFLSGFSPVAFDTAVHAVIDGHTMTRGDCHACLVLEDRRISMVRFDSGQV